MKYEYLKGSEKDFEGAPNWAHQVIKSTSIYGYAFVDGFDYMCKYQARENPCDIGNIINPSVWKVIAERQPITEPSWDGVGLPPVGCECEIKRVADWMPVTIRFISNYHTVFTTFGGTEDCYDTCSLQFRPIRSEADKKREEFINYLHCDESLGMHRLFKSTAEALYDLISAGKIPGVKLED